MNIQLCDKNVFKIFDIVILGKKKDYLNVVDIT